MIITRLDSNWDCKNTRFSALCNFFSKNLTSTKTRLQQHKNPEFIISKKSYSI